MSKADSGSHHGRRSAAAEIAALASRAGADEALESLVGQFADPLSFLRELVQNSLDAASTRIDVDFELRAGSPGKSAAAIEAGDNQATEKKKGKKGTKSKQRSRGEGMMTISVSDNGEGMNEGIIDRCLLTLFSSTKENDLTKIGKFGVGFVSIFAIEPELVVLETGQAGESWRIIFAEDRSYEKLRVDEPIEGTSVVLYKRVTRSDFDDLRRRGRDTVAYWCKYAEAEILVDGQPIAEEFAVDGALAVRHEEPGTSLALAFAPLRGLDQESTQVASMLLAEAGRDAPTQPLVGFYNRGLTLVEGVAVPEHSELNGISLRIKSRYLEHTLTRDNVKQDENFDKAVDLIKRQVDERLRPHLVTHLQALASHRGGKGEDPGPPSLGASLVYARLPAMSLHQRERKTPFIPTIDGPPISLRKLSRLSEPIKGALSAPAANPLTQLLAKKRIPVVLDQEGVVEYLAVCGIRVYSADAIFHTALEVEVTPLVAELLREVDRQLDRAKAKVGPVLVGDIDYPRSPVAGRLFVRQERAFEMTHLGEDDRPGLFGGARDLVLGWKHPLVKSCVELAETDLPLAAQLLAQSVATAEQRDRKRILAMAESGIDSHLEALDRGGSDQLERSDQ